MKKLTVMKIKTRKSKMNNQANNELRIPIIKIKDDNGQRVHIVGSDIHDSLYIDNKGRIAYRNLQNGGGLDDWYKFTADKAIIDSPYQDEMIIEFVTMAEFKVINEEHLKNVNP